MKKKTYWFKVSFGKIEDEEFNPEASFLYVAAWSALHAAKKAEKQAEEDEIVITIQYLGYPQL